MPIPLRISDIDLYLDECRTRLPFRFGISTLTEAPLCTVRVVAETAGGERHEGVAADLLVPKWFDKDPETTVRQDIEALADSVREAAVELLDTGGAASVFDHWWRLYRARVASRPTDARDRLRRGFGVALLERAMMDAACRAARTSFFEAWGEDLFGFRPHVVRTELSKDDVRSMLPPRPRRQVHVRHTVGLLDALTEAELSSSDRVSDGLPESLEEDVRRGGLQCFKLKLGGNREQDVPRLSAIAEVLRNVAADPVRVTIDGNEQFDDVASLVGTLEALRATSGGWLLDRLVSIEQPLPRTVTFDRDRHAAMDELDRFAPVIIDEADDDVEAFPRAVTLGYRGVSVKNCKGVFRAMVNRMICARSGGRLLQSAEDLTNLPVIALQQDLCTVATLGLDHVERNGHHYFRGLDHLPSDEVEAALASHGDLYERLDGTATLRITDGRLELGSLFGIGYGYDVPIRWDKRKPL